MTAVVPKQRPARVTLVLKDGSSATTARQSHRGDFAEPFSESEIREKFRELAGEVLDREGVEAAEHAIDRVERWRSVREFTSFLARGIPAGPVTP